MLFTYLTIYKIFQWYLLIYLFEYLANYWNIVVVKVLHEEPLPAHLKEWVQAFRFSLAKKIDLNWLVIRFNFESIEFSVKIFRYNQFTEFEKANLNIVLQ